MQSVVLLTIAGDCFKIVLSTLVFILALIFVGKCLDCKNVVIDLFNCLLGLVFLLFAVEFRDCFFGGFDV